MRDTEFEIHMRARGLAEKTIAQRVYALKRIERAHETGLDAEIASDGLAALLSAFSYSAADARAGRANPSRMDIDPERLLSHLRWYKSHQSNYLAFANGGAVAPAQSAPQSTPDDALDDELVEDIVGRTFALEKDLQSSLRANLDQLEKGLAVADGGIERRVEAGFIDILARDAAGVLVVIELKAELARPDAVAQILTYMGCIAEETGEPVRGILIAGEHHQRVRLAARAIPNLDLRRYRYSFAFE